MKFKNKINETYIWFFEKINKIDKPLTRKRKKIQTNNSRNEKRNITTYTADIKSEQRNTTNNSMSMK